VKNSCSFLGNFGARWYYLQGEEPTVWTIRTRTSHGRGSGIEDVAGIRVCMIGYDNRAYLRYIPPFYSSEDEQELQKIREARGISVPVCFSVGTPRVSLLAVHRLRRAPRARGTAPLVQKSLSWVALRTLEHGRLLTCRSWTSQAIPRPRPKFARSLHLPRAQSAGSKRGKSMRVRRPCSRTSSAHLVL
jgi:hypothetical protein